MFGGSGKRVSIGAVVAAFSLSLSTGALGLARAASPAAPSPIATNAPALRVHRIITLTPSLGELVALFPDALGVLVGVSDYSDYPAPLKAVERMGGYQRLNFERIFALKPDLLLAAEGGNAPTEIETLRRRHPDLLALRENSFADFLANVKIIGARIGREREAESIIAASRARLERIRSAHSNASLKSAASASAPALTVAIVVDEGAPIVAGGPTYFTEILTWIGAVNFVSDLAVKYPKISREEIVRRDPDAIVLLGSKSADAFRARFPNLRATRASRVYPVNDDALARPGPRLLDAAEKLAALLRPRES